MSGPMTYAQARTALGDELADQIAAQPREPMTPEVRDRVVAIFLAALRDTPEPVERPDRAA